MQGPIKVVSYNKTKELTVESIMLLSSYNCQESATMSAIIKFNTSLNLVIC